MGSHNDPIAELLTKIRNAKKAEHRYVDVIWSKAKEAIVKILKEEGFIVHYLVKEEKRKGTMRIFLKYAKGRSPVILGMKRVSSPSARKYISHDEIPSVMGGMGVAILSTPKGIVNGKVAKEEKVGGELLCLVW